MEFSILRDDIQMEKYYLYHAMLGASHERLNDKSKATDYYKKAISLTYSETEKQFLNEKITNL
jgi:predicted RNA polymerase sigma factor